jgi:hypothetical protein
MREATQSIAVLIGLYLLLVFTPLIVIYFYWRE